MHIVTDAQRRKAAVTAKPAVSLFRPNKLSVNLQLPMLRTLDSQLPLRAIGILHNLGIRLKCEQQLNMHGTFQRDALLLDVQNVSRR
ncbi:hypothetical protein D3C71_1983530 [compost metagenome]